MNNARRGFALIVSVLVLSSILITVAAATAFSLAGTERRGVVLRDSLAARGLAEGCANAALMKLRADSGYAGNETLSVAGSSCAIKPLVAGSTTYVETEATVNADTYRLKIGVSDLATLKISSWQRVASF